jgi:hypothetical protein
MQRKLLLITSDFIALGQLLIIYSAFFKYLRKNGNTMKQCIGYEAVHRLFIEFKKAYESVRVEVLCNTLIEFGIPMKLRKFRKNMPE